MPEISIAAAPPSAPAQVQLGRIGPHPILGEAGRLQQRQLFLRGLTVRVNADGANGRTHGTPALARELGLYVPPGAASVPLAAYHPADWGPRSLWEPKDRGPLGLDAPENGGRRVLDDEGHVARIKAWGFLLGPYGWPAVQHQGDPAPGYYLSTTALEDPRYAETDARRYFDSAALPGWTLPGDELRRFGVQRGDLAKVRLGSMEIWVQAFDSGHELLELSVAACLALGICARGRDGGGDAVDLVVYPGSGAAMHWRPGTLESINAAGEAHLRAVGLTGD